MTEQYDLVLHAPRAITVQGEVACTVADTSYFIGNSAGWASLRGIDATAADLEDETAWVELVPTTRLQPDGISSARQRHRR